MTAVQEFSEVLRIEHWQIRDLPLELLRAAGGPEAGRKTALEAGLDLLPWTTTARDRRS